MEYDVSWLGTAIVLVIGLVLGVVSALFIQSPRPVMIWSVLVSGVFIASAMLAVVACYSWMFDHEARGALEQIALAAAVTGITFANRSAG